MKENAQNQESLKWQVGKTLLTAETFGQPASEIVMDCRVCTQPGEGFRSLLVKALWDTGTSTTVISPRVASRLGLKPKGSAKTNAVGSVRQSGLTSAYLWLPNSMMIGPMMVVVDEIPSVDVLLGMDVIRFGKFTIERKPDGGTRFTFDIKT